MILQKICFVLENWNLQCLFITMFRQFWGFMSNLLVKVLIKVISDEGKWLDDLLLGFSRYSSDCLNVFWEKRNNLPFILTAWIITSNYLLHHNSLWKSLLYFENTVYWSRLLTRLERTFKTRNVFNGPRL